MPEVNQVEHDSRELKYRVRVKLIAEIIDVKTGEVIADGEEDFVKQLYRFLKRRVS